MNYGNDAAAMRQDKQANYQGASAAEGYGVSGGSVSGDALKRQPEATRYLNELEKNLTHCDAALSELTDRLGRVTRTEPPATIAGSGTPREVTQSSLGGAIQEMADRAAALSGRIRQVTARLEV